MSNRLIPSMVDETQLRTAPRLGAPPHIATPRTIHVNIDDPAQVDALFEAVAQRKTPEELADILRQVRSPEEIRRDNAEAQADYERYRIEQGGSL